jgi:hypothetical protein
MFLCPFVFAKERQDDGRHVAVESAAPTFKKSRRESVFIFLNHAEETDCDDENS